MNPSKRCALKTFVVAWNFIPWDKVYEKVRSLQRRIAKAISEVKPGKAKALQWIMTHSFAAKLLAVKRVTENKGKNTSGVDGVLWKTSKDKIKAALSLSRHGYTVKPLRRVYINKKNGKKRPLGIPTMKDRAMQALFLSALDPVSETTADFSSYGFRRREVVMTPLKDVTFISQETTAQQPYWKVTSRDASIISVMTGSEITS